MDAEGGEGSKWDPDEMPRCVSGEAWGGGGSSRLRGRTKRRGGAPLPYYKPRNSQKGKVFFVSHREKWARALGASIKLQHQSNCTRVHSARDHFITLDFNLHETHAPFVIDTPPRRCQQFFCTNDFDPTSDKEIRKRTWFKTKNCTVPLLRACAPLSGPVDPDRQNFSNRSGSYVTSLSSGHRCSDWAPGPRARPTYLPLRDSPSSARWRLKSTARALHEDPCSLREALLISLQPHARSSDEMCRSLRRARAVSYLGGREKSWRLTV